MSLTAISPLDGRYAAQTAALADHFSEYALIKRRVQVEVEWLIALSQEPAIGEVRALTPAETALLRGIFEDFAESDAARVKEIERTTNHDVKAVEYLLREKLETTTLAELTGWLHFACTSEDINNLAHALMCRGGIQEVWRGTAQQLVETVAEFAERQAAQPMLAHTHGQPASPTTVGKELGVFVRRWRRQLALLDSQEYLGKLNGAVGNFNAHLAAYPNAPWEKIAEAFVTSLGLTYNPLTTQIEPHDYLAECFHALIRFNNITLDFVRDIWTYISFGYFKQHLVAGEVGSSTMPHKVNPINFENAEANLGLSNSVLDHLASKLTVSRLQRDLTDSSAIRNIGVGVAYSHIANLAALRGVAKLAVNADALGSDLDHTWEVLGEAVQTVMRKHGISDAYEQLKALTRGAAITGPLLREFITSLALPQSEKDRLLAMTPASYVGIAPDLLRHMDEPR